MIEADTVTEKRIDGGYIGRLLLGIHDILVIYLLRKSVLVVRKLAIWDPHWAAIYHARDTVTGYMISSRNKKYTKSIDLPV